MYKFLIHNKAPATMNYNLNNLSDQAEKKSTLAALKNLLQLIADEKRTLLLATITILINSTLNLLGPLIIGHTIDKYVQTKQYHGVLVASGILLSMYLVALV